MSTVIFNFFALVGKNNAIVMTEKAYKDGQYKLFTANSSMAAGLMAMEYLLNKASDNTTIDKDVLQLYVPDTLKGFAGKAYIEYIRTNKTAGGRAFTDEEKELVSKVAMLLCTKGLNTKVTESKYMTKELSAFKDVVLKTAKDLKVNAPAPQAQSQAPSQAKSPVVAKLEELMTKALEEGDFDTYDKLEERLNKITGQASAPAPVVDEEPVEEEEQIELNVDEEIADLDC